MTDKELINEAITVANDIISGKIHMVTGCRKLIGLTEQLDQIDETEFVIFKVVESEADPFPIEDRYRALWNKEALVQKDKEYQVAVAGYFPDVKEACQKLIKKIEPGHGPYGENAS